MSVILSFSHKELEKNLKWPPFSQCHQEGPETMLMRHVLIKETDNRLFNKWTAARRNKEWKTQEHRCRTGSPPTYMMIYDQAL